MYDFRRHASKVGTTFGLLRSIKIDIVIPMALQKLSISIPTDPSRRGHWIVLALRVTGSGVYELAREYGVTASAVSQAIAKGRSVRLQRAIAEKLGFTVHQLWPERFDENGRHLRRRRTNRIAGGAQRHGEKTRVA